MSERTGFPRGWFVVAWSSDLGPGGVRPLHYFDQHLVAFRTESGEVRVLDAFCPHLGAHLGHGGKVEGESVVCPFHAWRFDGSGRCTGIPYADKIPRQATVRAWEVVERNGAVFVWHDAAGGPPTWEVPLIESYGDAGWTPWRQDCMQVKTHPREIVENVADKAHFPIVHRTEVSRFVNEYEGHTATQRTTGVARPPQGGVDHFHIDATYFGPAFQISDMKGYLHSRLLLAHTPITERLLDLRFAVSLERSGPRSEQFAEFYAENLRLGFHEDLSIWENKVYRQVPRLCDGDGPVGRLRTWYRQFYEPVTAEATPAS
jgi:3-ketosteroid 9alpha-monooxygenase subunit A